MRKLLALAAAAALSGCGIDGPDPAPQAGKPVAAVERPPGNPLNNAYFGDLHVHTTLSLDSYVLGNRQGPEEAYRFARGEAVRNAGGEQVQLSRPLDFVALTDHAEQFHLYQICVAEPEGPLYRTKNCELMRKGDTTLTVLLPGGIQNRDAENCPGGTVAGCQEAARRLWTTIRTQADRANQPNTARKSWFLEGPVSKTFQVMGFDAYWGEWDTK